MGGKLLGKINPQCTITVTAAGREVGTIILALETGKVALRKVTYLVSRVQLRSGRARVLMLRLSLCPAAYWNLLSLTSGFLTQFLHWRRLSLLPSSSCSESLCPLPTTFR